MKKWILVLMLLVAASGCNTTTAWMMTAPDSDVNARVGATLVDDGSLEGVVEVGYDSSRDLETVSPDRIGGLLIYHPTQVLQWEDTPVLSPFADVLDSLEARPYVGVGPMVNWDTQELEAKWVAGVTFADSPARPWAFTIEYQDGDGPVTATDDSAVFLGFRCEF
jgi:hypothetical protein